MTGLARVMMGLMDMVECAVRQAKSDRLIEEKSFALKHKHQNNGLNSELQLSRRLTADHGRY